MDQLTAALLYATIAGATIPLGGLAACVERVQPQWLEQEFRHSVIAFGGGVLLAAIALVLVPAGTDRLTMGPALLAFAAGGVLFFALDRLIERRGGAGAQLMAMLLDFLPESMAMGAMLATQSNVGVLLALLIALQNLPEGFNAYRELRRANRIRPALLLAVFCALVPLGPLAAWLGLAVLGDLPRLLGAIMLLASGGILYLTFEDIAPQAYLERHWAPPLGAVLGFLLGLAGHMAVT